MIILRINRINKYYNRSNYLMEKNNNNNNNILSSYLILCETSSYIYKISN